MTPRHSRTSETGRKGATLASRRGISAYRRIAALLRRRISTGDWQAGQRLPSLEALVEEFKVARVTIRHALDLLAEEGLIVRHRDRRGSSVIAHSLDRRWFTLALDPSDLETHTSTTTAKEIAEGPWTKPLPTAPHDGHPAPAYHRVVHLHHHDDFPHPVAVTDLLIESNIYARLERDGKRNRPVLERMAALHADFGSIRQTMTVGEADLDLAKHLGMHEAAPVVELRRVIRDPSDIIIYFGTLFFRGDLVRLEFSADLTDRTERDRKGKGQT